MSQDHNRFFYETTPKPRQPTVASSQHRSEFVPYNKEPNTPPAGRQVASAPEIRRGRRTTGFTPRQYRGFSTNKVSESRASLVPQIKAELEDKIIVIKTSAFIRAFLYGNDVERMAADEERARNCLLDLKQNRVPEGVPKYEDKRILFPTPNVFEDRLYPAYINLLEYVNNSFRAAIKDVDHDWLPAEEPSFHPPTPTHNNDQPLPLHRIYRNTHDKTRAFSRNRSEQAVLKPDLCLVVESYDNPDVSPHWKDVLVPIEVKRDNMDGKAVGQSARYARAVLMEQFDRKFAFSVLLTSDECRVFYWNTVGAHVTEAINIHSDTETFFQVMGRLATMKPADLGYDTDFSNAGRVLSSQKNLKTYLTMRPSKPEFFLDSTAPTPLPIPPLVLDIAMQFESKGLLFNRSTRVWRGVVVNEGTTEWTKGDTYIVKQNWADDSRPNEGYFHGLAKDIPEVPELACMEVCDSTSSYHARVAVDEVRGFLFPLNAKRPGQPPMQGYSGPGGDAPRTPDAGSRREVDKRSLDDRDDYVTSDDQDAGGVEDAGDAPRTPDAGSRREVDKRSFDDREDYVTSDVQDAGGVEDAGGVKDAGGVEDAGDVEEAIYKEYFLKPKTGDDSPSGKPKSDKRGYYLERVLLRFAFKREGRPLKEAKNSVELLEATVQWIKGLIALHKAGIIHRDISIGNLLLPKDDKDKQASIIDLGLAHYNREPPSGSKPRDHASTRCNKGSRWSSQPHCRVTGTLPFIAYDLLAHASDPKACEHALHHDIESIFWVLLFVGLSQSGEKPSEKPSPASTMLDALSSDDVGQVKNQKLACLTREKDLLLEVSGTFWHLQAFLHQFAKHYEDQAHKGKVIDAEIVLQMAKNHLGAVKKVAEGDLPAATPSTSQQPDRSTHQRTDPKPHNDKLPSDPPRTNKPPAPKRKKIEHGSLQTIDEDPQAHQARSAKKSRMQEP